MAKWFTGGTTALVVWLGSMMMAEAQVGVDVTGPTCVNTGQSSTYVTGIVTGVTGQYEYNIVVTIDSVERFNRKYWTLSPLISKGVGYGSWGLTPEQAWVSYIHVTWPDTGSGFEPADIVSPTTYLPSKAAPQPAPAALLKEEDLAWVVASEEAAA
jgi:hypothetical protein